MTAGLSKPPHFEHFGNWSTGILADGVLGSGLPKLGCQLNFDDIFFQGRVLWNYEIVKILYSLAKVQA